MKDHDFDYFRMSYEELKDAIKGVPAGIQNWHTSRWYEVNYCEREERRPRYGRDYEEG